VTGVTIGIDVRKIRDYGIGRYIEGLVRALAEDGGEERYVLFEAADPDRDVPDVLRQALRGDRFRIVASHAAPYSARELLAFRGAATRYGLDLLHFPHYARGFAVGCPAAVTVHDAIHLSHPPSQAARLYAWTMLQWVVRTTACVLTVSAAARDDLARRLGVSPDRFRVTPNGVDPSFAPTRPGEVAAFRAARNLAAPFVLCMTSHRPHKNLAGAIAAFRLADLDGAKIVVPARDEAAARRLASAIGDAPDVVVLHDVRDHVLPSLYGAARLVLCPSLAEGFGLPGLEAAACGAAVLATPIAAHREVLADAAAYAAGGAPADLSAALSTLWHDEARLAELRRRGPARADRFRWAETARRTRDAYRETIEVSRRRDLC
jgi:glycosyltransferase involved in cell wall biosynthesis